MFSSNPILKEDRFNQTIEASTGRMTVDGTVNKVGISLMILIAGAAYSWSQFLAGTPTFMAYGTMGAIIGLILAFAIMFKPKWAPVLVPVYAGLQGLFIGGISAFFEVQYPGMVMQAVGLTFGALAAMLGLYKSGMIQVTQKFRTGMMIAVGAIMLVYLAQFILGFFGVVMPFFGHGNIGIIFSLIVVGIAAFSLILDFDFIERASAQGSPKYMEWLGAFGLLVTLIWLYMEILRLLVKFQQRRD